jgi:hypothetical protein
MRSVVSKMKLVPKVGLNSLLIPFITQVQAYLNPLEPGVFQLDFVDYYRTFRASSSLINSKKGR